MFLPSDSVGGKTLYRHRMRIVGCKNDQEDASENGFRCTTVDGIDRSGQTRQIRIVSSGGRLVVARIERQLDIDLVEADDGSFCPTLVFKFDDVQLH